MMSMTRMNLKGKQTQGKKKCDSSPVNPPQLNHHRWKNILCILITSQAMWSSRPSLNSAVAHITRQYISNMACMFKYIGDTQVHWVMMNALCGVFIFQMHISEHEPQTILSLHTWRSIRKLYASCLFAKSMSSCFLFLRPLIVCLLTKRHCVYVRVHFIRFVLPPYCVLAFVSLFFFSFACIPNMLLTCKFLLRYCTWGSSSLSMRLTLN